MVDPNAPAWVITNQQETTDVGPGGTYVAGMRVTFRTQGGVIASVFVPTSDYNADTVRQLVSDKAATADAIAGLQG